MIELKCEHPLLHARNALDNFDPERACANDNQLFRLFLKLVTPPFFPDDCSEMANVGSL